METDSWKVISVLGAWCGISIDVCQKVGWRRISSPLRSMVDTWGPRLRPGCVQQTKPGGGGSRPMDQLGRGEAQNQTECEQCKWLTLRKGIGASENLEKAKGDIRPPNQQNVLTEGQEQERKKTGDGTVATQASMTLTMPTWWREGIVQTRGQPLLLLSGFPTPQGCRIAAVMWRQYQSHRCSGTETRSTTFLLPRVGLMHMGVLARQDVECKDRAHLQLWSWSGLL